MVCFTPRKTGCELAEAIDGKDGIAKAASGKFDLIITDLNMPNLDCIQLITAVGRLPRYSFVPILMLSAESHAENKDAVRKAGPTGWIAKLFSTDQLAAVVQKTVE
jgi:two-component system chemotaxis response regulator CheY